LSEVAFELLAEAQRYGIRLTPTASGTIKASAPKSPPPEVLAKLKAHRSELLSALAEPETGGFEERAAIIEHDGSICRAWAEGFARLDPNRPPANVPLRRWRAVIDAIGAFLDRWAPEAIAKGWKAADIFGADAIRPEVAWLNAGPLWCGNGARVIEVHPDHIVFETRSGVRQTHYRCVHMRPRTLPWELQG